MSTPRCKWLCSRASAEFFFDVQPHMATAIVHSAITAQAPRRVPEGGVCAIALPDHADTVYDRSILEATSYEGSSHDNTTHMHLVGRLSRSDDAIRCAIGSRSGWRREECKRPSSRRVSTVSY